MKKCPKCPNGKGTIPNYIAIDGGICYECNGKGWVSDNHVIRKTYKNYQPPQWVLEKEKKTMHQSYDNKRIVSQRVKKFLNELYNVNCYDIRDDVICCIDNSKYTDEYLVRMSDVDFQTVIVSAYEEYVQYA
jgi:hypothetical protein